MNAPSQKYAITRDMNLIHVHRLDDPSCVSAFIGVVHQGSEAGFTDFLLDFSGIQGVAFPNACAPLAGLLHFYTTVKKYEFSISGTLPEYLDTIRLMKPCSPTMNQTQTNIPCLDRVWKFTADEVSPLVTEMVREFSRSITSKEGVLQAFEWALNEIMDNVIQHSNTSCGFVMGQAHHTTKHMAVCVFDCGQGIFNSLKGSKHAPRNPLDAISLSLREGITRDTNIGQGNGLWGLYQIINQNKGTLSVTSSSASWMMSNANPPKTFNKCQFPSVDNGSTTVDFQLDTNNPISFSSALKGKTSAISLYMEQFETDADYLRYSLQDQSGGTGTRKSGERIRNEIINIFEEKKRPILLDFTGLSIVASSFADELVGKLVVHFGFVNFNSVIHLRNVNEEIRVVLDRSVTQRMLESAKSETSMRA